MSYALKRKCCFIDHDDFQTNKIDDELDNSINPNHIDEKHSNENRFNGNHFNEIVDHQTRWVTHFENDNEHSWMLMTSTLHFHQFNTILTKPIGL